MGKKKKQAQKKGHTTKYYYVKHISISSLLLFPSPPLFWKQKLVSKLFFIFQKLILECNKKKDTKKERERDRKQNHPLYIIIITFFELSLYSVRKATYILRASLISTRPRLKVQYWPKAYFKGILIAIFLLSCNFLLAFSIMFSIILDYWDGRFLD